MSLVVTLKPGMSGYEKHRMDYLISNYNGEYGYRRIRLTDTEFARYVYAHLHYAPIIQDLKNEINKLQWLVHDLRNERDALKTKLELTQVQCDKMTDRAYASAEENAMLHGIIKQKENP